LAHMFKLLARTDSDSGEEVWAEAEARPCSLQPEEWASRSGEESALARVPPDTEPAQSYVATGPVSQHADVRVEENAGRREEQPLPLHIEASPGAGRFYVAACDMAGGERLLETFPEAAVVHETLVPRVCVGCFAVSRVDPYTHRCQHCQYVSYCSSGCQRAHASAHARECAALGRLRMQRSRLDHMAMTRTRLALQVMCTRRQLSTKGRRDPTKELCSGLEVFEAMPSWRERRKSYRAICAAFAGAYGQDAQWLEPEVEELLGAIECNGFGLWDYQSDQLLGMSVCVSASLFNHSCAPNVARVTHGLRMTFYTLAPTRAGEALCISYLDPRHDRSQRRKELLDFYGFTCQCLRCIRNAWLPAMCPNHLGYMIPSAHDDKRPWCSVCGTADDMEQMP